MSLPFLWEAPGCLHFSWPNLPLAPTHSPPSPASRPSGGPLPLLSPPFGSLQGSCPNCLSAAPPGQPALTSEPGVPAELTQVQWGVGTAKRSPGICRLGPLSSACGSLGVKGKGLGPPELSSLVSTGGRLSGGSRGRTQQCWWGEGGMDKTVPVGWPGHSPALWMPRGTGSP